METPFKTYTALLCHDKGKVKIKTVAQNPGQAVAIIAAAEGCPPQAVVLI
ncbi:hypothetical protein [Flavobacterium psychrotrophum]|nr:hypothetical protein [Flavobacterium psychrotrophum]